MASKNMQVLAHKLRKIEQSEIDEQKGSFHFVDSKFEAKICKIGIDERKKIPQTWENVS